MILVLCFRQCKVACFVNSRLYWKLCFFLSGIWPSRVEESAGNVWQHRLDIVREQQVWSLHFVLVPRMWWMDNAIHASQVPLSAVTAQTDVRPILHWKFLFRNSISKYKSCDCPACNLHIAPYLEIEFRKIEHVLYCEIVMRLVFWNGILK